MSLMARSAVPAPFSIAPSWNWSGNDGSWSTFEIAVGTPPQSFHILPATGSSEVWVPIPQACEGVMINVPNCGLLRGVEEGRGFETNASSSWDLLGIYELEAEQNLWGPTGNPGQYGLDKVTLEAYPSGQSVHLAEQTVAGYATANAWVGNLGLGISVGSFADVHKGTVPSLLDAMKSQNLTSSLSFGYAAGASYSSPRDYGSLILGGYDKARFEPSNLNFSITGTDSKALPLNIVSVIAENTLNGTLSLLPDASSITTVIDSTISQMWLPADVCELFAEAFGLTYDETTGLYLVKSAAHRELVQNNPKVTFTVSSVNGSSATTNIELPYAAFDLQAGMPMFNASTNYFPLRRAANESQQVLGRAFLQEAYIFVDWERDYFTIGQSIHQNDTTNIVPVLSPAYDSGNDADSSGLSTGAIVGLAIGACAVIAAFIGVAALMVIRSRRRRRDAERLKTDLPTELHSEHIKPPEIMSAQVYEMNSGETSRHELSENAKPLIELQASTPESELDGDGERYGRYGWDKKPNTYYELP
ncbi:uncharacterized protein LTR77_000347 [Saxophila tyrrhenica]|uniref:Peptidase A1 domain-containing protein n=1 Tax=Saxophila tyrrhenica TaxID=1690608 RepID=A0AAV9PR12_9PEZI|nr:hypothetical protein LTR77_000347 [Saxophila tyrrhenica]